MKIRSVEATVVLALALAASPFSGADQQPADLQSLYEGHHWFALRHAAEQGQPPQFYRGAVEAAFHQPPQAKKRPHDHDAYEAHALLAGLYLRTGQYREALVQTDALLAEKPDAEDANNVQSLLRVLSQTPDQAVVQKKPSRVRMHIEDGNPFLPVAINDALTEYALDTDAAVSLLSESEAKRLGLAMRDLQTKIEGMSGAGVGARVAVADTFALGDIRLANVAFYVLSYSNRP